MFEKYGERLLLIGQQAGYTYRVTENATDSRYSLYIWNKKYDDYSSLLDAENALNVLMLGDLLCRRQKRDSVLQKNTRQRT